MISMSTSILKRCEHCPDMSVKFQLLDTAEMLNIVQYIKLPLHAVSLNQSLKKDGGMLQFFSLPAAAELGKVFPTGEEYWIWVKVKLAD